MGLSPGSAYASRNKLVNQPGRETFSLCPFLNCDALRAELRLHFERRQRGIFHALKISRNVVICQHPYKVIDFSLFFDNLIMSKDLISLFVAYCLFS
jgi:hypothetical protein